MPGIAESYARTAYRETQTQGLAPQQLLLQLYDFAIAGCVARDMRRASAALVELIAALDFDYEEIAHGLFRLYEYALRQVKAGQYESALGILRDLRDTWEQALATAGA
jgi:flagellin-specific chaperone FliS